LEEEAGALGDLSGLESRQTELGPVESLVAEAAR
jgi:hypothetical protein